MKKEQMIKDFSELYVGQNPRKMAMEYLEKKKREMFLLIIAAILILGLCTISDIQNSTLEDNRVFRNKEEGGKKEIALQMKTENGTWQDVNLELYPKEYSEEELELLFLEACEKLPETIRGKNETIKQINCNLNLVEEMEGFPFLITWDSSNPQILDEDGYITESIKGVNENIELTANFQYENWEREYNIWISVITENIENFALSLREELKEQERMTRDDEVFYLPEIFEKNSLQWRYVPNKSAIVLGVLFLIIIPFISYEKDREIEKQTKKRKEELKEDFSEFISKLILLLETGMSIKGALFYIAEDAKRNTKERRYLYIELLYICRQMKNGLSEKEAYELLGKRCNLPCYKKLSGLLVQHLQKGGSSILETLRKEAQKASEEQKQQMQKKGEEMGTKLLVPMIIMLGIVMVFIMVPALFSFQI